MPLGSGHKPGTVVSSRWRLADQSESDLDYRLDALRIKVQRPLRVTELIMQLLELLAQIAFDPKQPA